MEYLTDIRHQKYRLAKMWMHSNSLRTLGLTGESLMDEYGTLDSICIYRWDCENLELKEAVMHEYIWNAQW